MIKMRFAQLKALMLIILFSLISLLLPKCKYWVICERGTDARDNGWHFYNFLKKNHREIKVYYVIDKKSADYCKVAADAVEYGSLKNYWVVARAEKLISTHIGKFVPMMGGKIRRFLKFLENKFYFLQHGITYNNITFLHKKNVSMKLFSCSARPEYDFVKEFFGHENGVVQYTGFARYDNFHDFNIKKQILVMPTWRQSINNEKAFLNSKFYKQWQEFINNKTLHTLLDSIGYELIFYPHYELQEYLSHFSSSCPLVKIASFDKYDVQTLLKESPLLITDYSSVLFDFAYMKKSTIYYQFDADEFFKTTYRRGYFDFSKDGFGNVCDTSDNVVKEIHKLYKRNFIMEDDIANAVDTFFPLRDRNNCQRIYEAIISN